MDAFDKLQTDILVGAGLQKQAATGFYECICPACRSERVTGGFKFEPETIIYQCFRASCDATCVFTKGESVSKKFKTLMSIIGVKIPAELRIKKNSIQKMIEKELEAELYVKHGFKQMDIPTGWEPLTERDVWWIDYFEKRKCNPFDMFVVKTGPYKGAAAIPMYYYDKLIGFQSVHPESKVKYITHTDDNDNLLMINGGFINHKPIVVEGILDAMCFPSAIGTLKKKVSKEQAYHLRGKDVHLFPDRIGGHHFIEQMKVYGWKAIIPPWRDVKDLNDCVMRYGKVATAMMMLDNTYTDYTKARVAYGLWNRGDV